MKSSTVEDTVNHLQGLLLKTMQAENSLKDQYCYGNKNCPGTYIGSRAKTNYSGMRFFFPMHCEKVSE